MMHIGTRASSGSIILTTLANLCKSRFSSYAMRNLRGDRRCEINQRQEESLTMRWMSKNGRRETHRHTRSNEEKKTESSRISRNPQVPADKRGTGTEERQQREELVGKEIKRDER